MARAWAYFHFLLLTLSGCQPTSPPDSPPARPEPAFPSPATSPAPTPSPGAPSAHNQKHPEETPLSVEPRYPSPEFSHWGLRWTQEKSDFRVHAPIVKNIDLLIFPGAKAREPEATHRMRATNEGSFELSLPGNLEGKTYAYQLTYESGHQTRVVDPFASHLVANSTLALIVPPGKSDPPGWKTKPRLPQPASPVDAIIYEAHLRDLTRHPRSGVKSKGTYLGWTETETTLDGAPDAQPTAVAYLKQLGVTHVHLLPVMDFENDERKREYNWGYMTEGWFSPEGMYASNPDDPSRVTEFKQCILALHEQGIGVIMDVVFNHAAHRSPLQSLGGTRFFRTWPDGSWSNGSLCGNDLKTEDPWVREFIIQSCEYWVKQYDVDGFRFDLMGLMDAETMRQVERRLRTIKPGIILYGEPWQAAATPLQGTPADKSGLREVPGIAAFNDSFRNALKGLPKGPRPGFIMDGSAKDELLAGIGGQENWGYGSPARIVNYMTAHDDLVLADKFALAMPGLGAPEMRARAMQGYLILLTSQGVPFLHAGCEFLRTKKGNDNSYNAGDEINAIDWGLLEEHLLIHRWVKALITLRKEHPLFRLRDYEEIRQRLRFHHMEKPGILMFTINGEGLPGETWKHAMVAINVSSTDTAELDLPDGQWTPRLDSRREQTKPIQGRVTLPPLAAWLAYR